MKQSYFNYDMDDNYIRMCMTPAISPNMQNNYQYDLVDNRRPAMIPGLNTQSIFAMPSEGFLRGNLEANTYEPYKNMNYIRPTINNEREAMLYKVQEMSFASHDLNLYLDTHPNDSSAIKLYDDYNRQTKRLTDEYERKYGPLDLSDEQGLSKTPWTWIKGPWPWNN